MNAYGRVARSSPDYPAVQAVATGVLALHCAQLAGSTAPDALWATATDLQTTTLYGAFAVDRHTGVQVGHAPVLVRWNGDELQLAA
jgi:hypothetical protein